RLFQRVTGEDTESMRHSGFLRRLPNPSRDLVHDHVIVGRISAEQASEANDAIVFLGFGERAGGGGDFEGAGYADDFDVVFFRTGADQSVVGAPQQAVSDELVKSRDY